MIKDKVVADVWLMRTVLTRTVLMRSAYASFHLVLYVGHVPHAIWIATHV